MITWGQPCLVMPTSAPSWVFLPPHLSRWSYLLIFSTTSFDAFTLVSLRSILITASSSRLYADSIFPYVNLISSTVRLHAPCGCNGKGLYIATLTSPNICQHLLFHGTGKEGSKYGLHSYVPLSLEHIYSCGWIPPSPPTFFFLRMSKCVISRYVILMIASPNSCGPCSVCFLFLK